MFFKIGIAYMLHLEHLDNEPITVYVQGKLTPTLSISAWVQVDLKQATDISGLMIQGRGAGSKQWVTELQVFFSNDGVNWQKGTVNGNTVSSM